MHPQEKFASLVSALHKYSYKACELKVVLGGVQPWYYTQEAQLDPNRQAVDKAKDPQVIQNSDYTQKLKFHSRLLSISVANHPQKYNRGGVT